MYMENSMDLFNGQRCLKLFFLRANGYYMEISMYPFNFV